MSHFACRCGYVFVDITDFLPYKAYFLPDEDVESSLTAVIDLLSDFVVAREHGDQAQFLAQHKPWLVDHASDMHDLIRNLFSHPTFSRGRNVYECPRCGRLWLESVPEQSHLVSYVPESPLRGVLRHEGATIPGSADTAEDA